MLDRGQPRLALALLSPLAVLLISCATAKSQIVDISPRGGMSDIQAVKCAAQQAGWTVTYSDADSLSGTKALGMDNVTMSLNIRLQTNGSSQHEAVITVGSPRGIIGDGSYYSKPIVQAFETCGASAILKAATP